MNAEYWNIGGVFQWMGGCYKIIFYTLLIKTFAVVFNDLIIIPCWLMISWSDPKIVLSFLLMDNYNN